MNDDGITVEFLDFGPIEVTFGLEEPVVFELEMGETFPIEFQLGTPGPQGERGPKGDLSASSLSSLTDVELSNLQDNDAIVYSSAKFRNLPIKNLTDGGNF